MSGLKKRSFSISGHRTSVALEDEFWAALKYEAQIEGLALAALVARVDENREGRNLASALRVHVLTRVLSERNMMAPSEPRAMRVPAE
jgi:predicted DNA-binding ribbon-helix-helix protein